MAKPSEVPEFATDANYDAVGKTWDGTPTKIDPGAGLKAEGWEPTFKPPGQYFNWLQNLVGQWLSWIDGHLGETGGRLDVLNGVNDLDVTGDLGVTGDIDLGQEVLYTTAKSRTIYLPIQALQPERETHDIDRQRDQVSIGAASEEYFLPVHLPNGSVLQSVRARVLRGGSPTSNDMRMQVVEVRATADPEISGNAVTVLASQTVSTGVGVTLDANSIAHTVDNTDSHLFIAFRARDNATSGARDNVFWVEVTYDDPGPRNH